MTATTVSLQALGSFRPQQNVPGPALPFGRGGNPAVPGQRLNAAIIVQDLLKTPEQFGAIPERSRVPARVLFAE